ncbi:hypothetical protein LINGRAHAP2_LOCUS11370 [Linum grandiflorum]
MGDSFVARGRKKGERLSMFRIRNLWHSM